MTIFELWIIITQFLLVSIPTISTKSTFYLLYPSKKKESGNKSSNIFYKTKNMFSRKYFISFFKFKIQCVTCRLFVIVKCSISFWVNIVSALGLDDKRLPLPHKLRHLFLHLPSLQLFLQQNLEAWDVGASLRVLSVRLDPQTKHKADSWAQKRDKVAGQGFGGIFSNQNYKPKQITTDAWWNSCC